MGVNIDREARFGPGIGDECARARARRSAPCRERAARNAMPEETRTAMKIFTCKKCNHVLFFENVRCTRCGATLAYLPDRGIITALEPESGAAASDPVQTVYVQIGPTPNEAG